MRARESGLTPLLLATSNGHLRAAEVLLDHRADVDRAANDQTSPLAMACLVDDTDMAVLLLARSADPNTARGGSTTRPWLFVQFSSVRCLVGCQAHTTSFFAYLLPVCVLGCYLLAVGPVLASARCWEVARQCVYSLLFSMTRLPADSGSAPIHFAALHNNAELLRALLDSKAQPSLENGQGLTALKVGLQARMNDAGQVVHAVSTVSSVSSHTLTSSVDHCAYWHVRTYALRTYYVRTVRTRVCMYT